MADTITRVNLENTSRRLVVRAQLDSDGTGSTDGILVDKSTYVGPDGTEPTKFVIEKIDYNIDGMQIVVEFEHDTDDHIITLAGQGVIDFCEDGKYQGYVDPASTGGTGDIVGTTVGHTAGDKGTVIFYLRKKD